MQRGRLFNTTNNDKTDQNNKEKTFNTHVKNFDAFFNLELAPEIEQLAKLRNQLWSKAINKSIWMIALVLVVMLVFMFFLRALPLILFALAAAIIACIIIFTINYKAQKETYNTSFKNKIIKKLMLGIDERLQYQPDLCISQNEYLFSKIFRQRVDKFHGEDLIETTIDKTNIKFSELHTEQETETIDSKGRRQTKWTTIFKGVFFIMDFNKNFEYETVVLPDYNQQIFGDLLKSFQFGQRGNGKLVNMDHPEFEKLFKVYSTNAIEAHYLLSPNLMESIVQVKEKFNSNIYLSFSDSKLHLAISNYNNLFESPNLWGNPNFLNLIKTYHDYLHNCLEIVNDLNLNLRIWSKN